MKFIHAADLHLDSPLRGLEYYQGAPVEALRGATRRALENLVQLCLNEEVDLLLIAGDLYDGDWRDYNTGLFFIQQMARLCREGIRVVLIRGNHDAASQLTRYLRFPEGVFELSTGRAETRLFEDLGVAVHGRGYPKREVTEDLAVGYPEAVQDLFNIGLLHTALDGRAGHDLYAPCSVQRLTAKGYQYWALGHVHQREVLTEDPWIVFPGNLQGRHARETGPKGASLVTVEDTAVVKVEHRPLDAVRWTLCSVDCSAAGSGYEVVELAREALSKLAETADGRLLATRLQLAGTCQAHRQLAGEFEHVSNEIRATLADLSGEVWLEKIRLQTRSPLDLDALLAHDDPLTGLLHSLRELRGDEASLRELLGAFADLKGRLPPEYRQLEDALDLDDPATLKGLLEDVEQSLLPRLLEIRDTP